MYEPIEGSSFATAETPKKARRQLTGSLDADGTVVRWSDDPSGLSVEECARRGIEAVAGLVISADFFGTNVNPGELFCTCVEMRHVAPGPEAGSGDHIVVYFRGVEFRDFTFPVVGESSLELHMQLLSDGNTASRWRVMDGGPGDRRVEGLDSTAEETYTGGGVSTPLPLGEIPEQEASDENPPSFLLLKDPGAGWQIWRRFYEAKCRDDTGVQGGVRDESYVMVYPMISADMRWRFRIHDTPEGGTHIEMVPGRKS